MCTEDGHIALRNCPFHQLARTHPDLVCGLNLDLIQGLLGGTDDSTGEAVLAPQDSQCCVVIHHLHRRDTTGCCHTPTPNQAFA